MAARKASTPARLWLRRSAWVAAIGLAAWFAVEGGEYGTRALFAQHARRARVSGEVAQLRHEIDSLQKELYAVQHDNATIERIAREEYGMVKANKELLFWVGGGRSRTDSSGAAADSARPK